MFDAFVGSELFDRFFARFAVAFLVLLIGLILGRVLGRFLKKFLHEIELDKIAKKAGIRFSLESVFSQVTTYIIYFFTVIWSLNELGLTTTILNMVSAAALVLIIISFLLAVKDFLPNMIAGFFIYQKGIIKVGDKVRIDKLEGRVSKISLVETEIATKKGDIIFVPNSSITKKEFVRKR